MLLGTYTLRKRQLNAKITPKRPTLLHLQIALA